MSLEVSFGERLARVCLLHWLAAQLEHHKDDHLAIVALVLMMIMMILIETRQKPTTLAKVPRNIAKMTRRSRVVPTCIMRLGDLNSISYKNTKNTKKIY